MKYSFFPHLLFCLALTFPALHCHADDIRVAVASNFAGPMHALKHHYEANSPDRIILSFSSTGKHYAQISHGAPFDLFLAADAERPNRLVDEGLANSSNLQTYALGKLVLWIPDAGPDEDGLTRLTANEFRYLAMANPKLAPYGRAAKEVLQHYGLYDALREKIVQGENISQAYQFVGSGNAELGFVALSQVMDPLHKSAGTIWFIPGSLYSPIVQQAVLLRDSTAARGFFEFLLSQPARAIIGDFGYDTP